MVGPRNFYFVLYKYKAPRRLQYAAQNVVSESLAAKSIQMLDSVIWTR